MNVTFGQQRATTANGSGRVRINVAVDEANRQNTSRLVPETDCGESINDRVDEMNANGPAVPKPLKLTMNQKTESISFWKSEDSTEPQIPTEKNYEQKKADKPSFEAGFIKDQNK